MSELTQCLSTRHVIVSNGLFVQMEITPLYSVIHGGGASAKLKEQEARRYVNSLQCAVMVRSQEHLSFARTCYEIKPRADVVEDKRNWSRSEWFGWTAKYLSDNPTSYRTPDVVRSALMGTHFKHAATGSWHTFNFDGAVTVLGSMLGLLSVYPDITTAEFRGNSRYDVKGVNQMSDMYAVAEAGSIYVSQHFCRVNGSNALWAFATAANIAGASVVMSYVDCDGNGAPLCRELAGGALVQGITSALSILGSYYSLAGAGDAFAISLLRGIHTPLSLVGHSDEGGWFRRVLRAGGIVRPHGGLPDCLSMSAGVGVLCSGGLKAITGYVDAIVIASAALVAHCDPCDVNGGHIFPTVIRAVADDEDFSSLSQLEVTKRLLQKLKNPFDQFSYEYARGAAKLFGLQAHERGEYGGAMLQNCFAALCADNTPTGERHLTYEVMAPFFWVEPTGVLPKSFLCSRAEEGGIGSLCGPGEKVSVPFLNRATAMAPIDMSRTAWAIEMRSLRTWGGYVYLANHASDGVANLRLRHFDCEALVLARQPPEWIYARKKSRMCVDPGELAWVRGQSKIPHPAECLNVDGSMGITVLHRKIEDLWLTNIDHIPAADEIHNTMVRYSIGGCMATSNGSSNWEPREVKRARTRGVETLRLCRAQVSVFMNVMNYEETVSERPPSLERPPGSRLGPLEVRPTEGRLENRVDTLRTEGAPTGLVGTSTESRGRVQDVARQHGAVTAPRPSNIVPQAGVGDTFETGVMPTDGSTVPIAVNDQFLAPTTSGQVPGEA